MDYLRGAEWRRWDLHLHTKSSYDYKYNGDDADEKLVQALRENDIKAVAVTDHFVIDSNRIKHLRELAPEIVFFPGVELRTDKGSNNLHMILIFSEVKDLAELEKRFDVIMSKQNAKSPDNNERIYWDFNDIIKFAQSEDALVSIHAGKKSSGVDTEIRTESYPYKDAVKDEIASFVHFFDMGQKRDFADYERFVFPEIGKRPMIICSDNHDPRNYSPSEALWIKADCTFEGLKQCVFQPSDRVYVGVIPPSLDRVNKNKRNTIDSVSIKRVDNAVHSSLNWFHTDIILNSNLVAVIGNKGSGKSALSDVLGSLCKSHTMDQASFLSEKRFRNPKTKYADDYEATITWVDGHSESRNLGSDDFDSIIENAQYLPQAYIEKVCNDIGDEFQKEINRVIFSYVDPVERGTAGDLNELVENKTRDNKAQQTQLINKLKSLNASIIKLENKKTSDYRKKIEECLEKLKEDLARHDANKPVEVPKPESGSVDPTYQNELHDINSKIEELERKREKCLDDITTINMLIDDINVVISELVSLEGYVGDVRLNLREFVNKHSIENLTVEINYTSPLDEYKAYLAHKQEIKNNLYEMLNGTPENGDGLSTEIDRLKKEREKLIENGNSSEKKYQKYVLDIEEWERQRKQIVGDETTPESLKYYIQEKTYIDETLDKAYQQTLMDRLEVVNELYKLVNDRVSSYNAIYEPIQHEIQNILSNIEEKIAFEAEIQLTDDDFVEKTLSFISQRYAGVFKGKIEARETMNQIVNSTSFDSIDSLKDMLSQVNKVITEDYDLAEKKVTDRQGFYDYLFGLGYVGVDFKLKVGGRELTELSPGERGIVLLIFYLALSKENTPIFVDQPEDNLDNQSVYSKLVPCINAAKEKRQVIIVTHNPNIAVACDAEQIIYCEMDKDNCSISYSLGSIENPETRKHVIDVLEGTMPAFELRQKKYTEKLEHI